MRTAHRQPFPAQASEIGSAIRLGMRRACVEVQWALAAARRQHPEGSATEEMTVAEDEAEAKEAADMINRLMLKSLKQLAKFARRPMFITRGAQLANTALPRMV